MSVCPFESFSARNELNEKSRFHSNQAWEDFGGIPKKTWWLTGNLVCCKSHPFKSSLTWGCGLIGLRSSRVGKAADKTHGSDQWLSPLGCLAPTIGSQSAWKLKPERPTASSKEKMKKPLGCDGWLVVGTLGSWPRGPGFESWAHRDNSLEILLF